MEEKRYCECCNVNEAVSVGASRLIPMSIAICTKCLENNAEPLGDFFATLDETDGDVMDWVKQLKSFSDGNYIDFDEIFRRWKEARKPMKARTFSEDMKMKRSELRDKTEKKKQQKEPAPKLKRIRLK